MASMLKSKLGGVSLRSRNVVAAPRISIKAAGLPSLRVSAKPVLGPLRQTISSIKPVTIPQRAPAPKAASSDAAVPVPEPEPKKYLGFEALTWAKIIPLAAMFFCILFNYTILRDTKDVLVVTAPGSGAEIIPFLKTWVNLPMAILFTIGYAGLSNTLSTEQLFYTCIIPFIIFFGSFAAFMYPARDFLHPTEYCKDLLETMGPRFAGPIAIIRNWTFCLFYVMAELWGSVVVSVLFWGFANQITTVEEASQFYPLFGLGANVALIFSGQAVKYFSLVRANLPPEVDGWGVSLNGLMGMVCIGGILISLIYFGLNRLVVPQIKSLRTKKKKVKSKMSVGESFGFLASSPYIRDMATLVVAYGISINLVEVTWKSKLKAQFPPQRVLHFHGRVLHRHRYRHLRSYDHVPMDLQEVRLGCGCQHHPHRAPDHRCDVLLPPALPRGCSTHAPGYRYHPPVRSSARRSCTERVLQGLQVLPVRPLQGDGIHSPGG